LYYTDDASTREIRIGGTGLLEVLAGRNINLGISRGITTVGDLLNGNLKLTEDDGASIIAVAGMGAALAPQKQADVGKLFTDLVTAGRKANEDPSTEFKGGYAALAAFFPGSQASNNPYSGDISMPFSRIYTLNGGSISLLAPGGEVNVGLANPPNL